MSFSVVLFLFKIWFGQCLISDIESPEPCVRRVPVYYYFVLLILVAKEYLNDSHMAQALKPSVSLWYSRFCVPKSIFRWFSDWIVAMFLWTFLGCNCNVLLYIYIRVIFWDFWTILYKMLQCTISTFNCVYIGCQIVKVYDRTKNQIKSFFFSF